jgi:hypothetical protein
LQFSHTVATFRLEGPLHCGQKVDFDKTRKDYFKSHSTVNNPGETF